MAVVVAAVVAVVVVRAGSEVEAVGQGPVESINLSPRRDPCAGQINLAKTRRRPYSPRNVGLLCPDADRTVGRIDAEEDGRHPAE